MSRGSQRGRLLGTGDTPIAVQFALIAGAIYWVAVVLLAKARRLRVLRAPRPVLPIRREMVSLTPALAPPLWRGLMSFRGEHANQALAMRRWLQFRLRTLLSVATLVCLVLGGSHLLDVYGNRIDVLDAKLGEPIHVRAQRIRLLGPEKQLFDITIARRNTGDFWYFHKWVKRTWCCLYTFDAEFRPIYTPGEFSVTLCENEEQDPRLAAEGRWRDIKHQQLELDGTGSPTTTDDTYYYESPSAAAGHDGRGYGNGPADE